MHLTKEQKLYYLYDRAELLARSRQFFAQKKIIEVDCPHLCSSASVDPYIDLMSVSCSHAPLGYLHSSPEYAMKRLLVLGIGDIYQLSHVFRDEECGRLHNPEFTMTEWYRVGISIEEMIAETIEYIQLFLGEQPLEAISYRDAFKKYAQIDYLHAETDELLRCLTHHEIEPYPLLAAEGKDALLNVILATVIEPELKKLSLCVLKDYPASQAALAKTFQKEDEKVAERFEIFYQGIELANGYHELCDPIEQRKRFQASNEIRAKEGRTHLLPDERFLKALEEGLPDCCGVAVGFDRLMMLRHQASQIADIMPFGWQEI